MHAKVSRLRRLLVGALIVGQMVSRWGFPDHPWARELQTALGVLVIVSLFWPSKDADTASPYSSDHKRMFSPD